MVSFASKARSNGAALPDAKYARNRCGASRFDFNGSG
jgi:hypothetical protein